MNAARSAQDAWAAYRGALDALYAAPTGETRVARGRGELRIDGLGERIEPLFDRSAELRESLEGAVGPDDVERGELAALKLLAAAVQDLAVAGDLLGLEEAGPGQPATRAARTVAVTPELKEVLEAPLEQGMRGLIGAAGSSRAALPKTPPEARAQLEKTIAVFLEEIPNSAASASRLAVAGAVTLGLGPLQPAASLAAQEVLARLPDGASIALRAAARLVGEAVHKLQAALGKEVEEQAREQAAKWFKDLQEGDVAAHLLEKLCDTPRLREETLALVAATPPDTLAEHYNEATRKLEELLTRYQKTKGVLEGLVRVLAFVKAPLLTAAPWGPLGLYTAHAGVLGYAVCSGGDYMDWYRVGEAGWLDRVEGLRTTVRKAMAAQGG